MTKPPKRPRDPNQLAKTIVDIATGEAADDPVKKQRVAEVVGQKGGRARAERLTPERRREIAQAAALTRWSINEDVDNQDGES